MRILHHDTDFIFWEESGIIGIIFLNKHITCDIAKKGVETRIRLTNARKCLLYADMSNVISMTREARAYYASYEGTSLVKACAVFTPSALAFTLVTFFINFNKPNTPYKTFTSKRNAFQWLKADRDYQNSNKYALRRT